jgi:hypothetical protein
MKAGGWRALLLALCAIVATSAVVQIYLEFGGPRATSLVGQWGDTVGASSQPFYLVVRSIDPGHGADLAGVRVGDLVDVRANAPRERFWLFGQPPTGHPVTILVRRGAQERRTTIVPQTATTYRMVLLSPIWLGFVGIALFAAIIAWRRYGDPQMRALCLLLVAYGLWESTNEHYVSSEHLWVLVGIAVANVLGTSCVAFWAACAGSFAPPRTTGRRAMQWLCYALVAGTIVVGLTRVVGLATLTVDPVGWASVAASIPFALAYAAAAACATLAIAATRGPERQRAIWSLVPGAVLIGLGFGAEGSQGVIKSYDLAWFVFYVAAAVNIATPMVLTYVALNRRLLDIGFVLNRAAVFTIVSTTLIAAFVIVEWVANEWFSANHATSAIVAMLVALALGFSIRYVHNFADRFVDRVLFHKRHEAEAALRRFAHEAGFITNRAALLDRAVATVKASTRAEASILVLDDAPAGIDDNDPALVALRAWRKPIDLELVGDSELHGQFAFPMVARGELIGALICGTKQDSEVYAPDESEALQSLADGVGGALSVLGHANNGFNGALGGAIAELRAAINDLRAMRS